MSNIINDPVLVTAIQDLARGIKSEADLSSLTRELLKITVEASLNAEMEAHLGYPKHSPTGHNSGNSRNGYGSKSLKGDHGVLEIETPRDRNGTFEPQFVRKNQTRLTHFDDKILTLPEGTIIGENLEEDKKRFYVSEEGGVVVTPEMLDQKLHYGYFCPSP